MTSTHIAPAPRAHSDATGIPATSRWLSEATPPERTPRVVAEAREFEAKIAENLSELADP